MIRNTRHATMEVCTEPEAWHGSNFDLRRKSVTRAHLAHRSSHQQAWRHSGFCWCFGKAAYALPLNTTHRYGWARLVAE